MTLAVIDEDETGAVGRRHLLDQPVLDEDEVRRVLAFATCATHDGRFGVGDRLAGPGDVLAVPLVVDAEADDAGMVAVLLVDEVDQHRHVAAGRLDLEPDLHPGSVERVERGFEQVDIVPVDVRLRAGPAAGSAPSSCHGRHRRTPRRRPRAAHGPNPGSGTPWSRSSRPTRRGRERRDAVVGGPQDRCGGRPGSVGGVGVGMADRGCRFGRFRRVDGRRPGHQADAERRAPAPWQPATRGSDGAGHRSPPVDALGRVRHRGPC